MAKLNSWCLVNAPSGPPTAFYATENKIYLDKDDEPDKRYEFDKVFGIGLSQDQVFSRFEPVIEQVDLRPACRPSYLDEQDAGRRPTHLYTALKYPALP